MKQSLTKRVISMLITVSMLLTMVPSVFAANPEQFKDFPKGWSKVAMEFSVDNGLLNGKSANTIEPQSNLTRAEMATIINRAFGAKITKDISAYTDVDKSDWYYTEMQKAVNMQTFQGDGNGKLRPDDAITREEVMAVIARAIVLETDDYSSISKFKDYSSVSDWAKPYVAVLIANGYVNGYEDNTIKPKANITREEFAQLMYNIFKTYLSAKDTSYTSVYDKNCVMINNEGINLSNVTIDGDLVLGDGVGTSKINLTNVTIKGRLLARGGIITLKNVTTGKGVVVKNVNGTTHFNNYRTDVVFNGVVEHTYTTYLTPSFSTGGGKPGQVVTMYDLTINYWYRDVATGTYVKTDVVNKRFSYGQKYTLEPSVETGFVFDKDTSDVETDNEEITVTGNREINLYYNALVWVEFVHPVEGYKKLQIPYGTSVEDAYKVAYGNNVKLVPTVTIGGNTYNVIWYVKDSNGENVLVNDNYQMTEENVEISYKLTADVVIYDNNGTKLTEAEVPVNADLYLDFSNLLKDEPTKTGYNFLGWYDSDGNKYDKNTNNTNKSPLEIYERWEAQTYTLTLNNDGATYVTGYIVPTQYKYDEELVLPTDANMTKDGYKFAGWYDNPSFKGNPVFTIPAGSTTGDKTYYAKWTKIHIVTFVYGNSQANHVEYVLDGEKVSKPQDPTWEGYTFKFWSLDGATEYYFATPVTSDITLTAVWETAVPPATTYQVTFVYGNGQADAKETVIKGEKVAKPQDPTWEGYKFQFWTVDGTTEYNFETPVTGNITIKAVWTKIHTVTFVYGNGQADVTEKVLDGDKVAKPQDPTWAGHQFKFWTADGTNEYDFASPVTGDMTITASWTGVHIVTFKYDNGDADTTQNVLDGEKAIKPLDPTRENYTFKFWSLDGVNEYDFDTPVTAPITLTAIWEVIDTTIIHTVKFYAFPQGTSREKFAGELEIVSGSTFGTEADGTISDKVKTIYREKQSDSEGRYELWDYANPYSISNMVVKGYFDSAENYQHYIRPDLVYLKNGKWTSFTGSTAVTADMEVYAVRRNVELYIEGTLLGISLPSFGATLATPYNSATRAVDSLKDALWLSRGSFDKVFTDKFQQDIFAKLAPKSKGLIDEEGYILNREFSMKIADVISTSDIEKEIRKYIEDIFDGNNEKLKEIIETIGVETLVRKIGIKSLVENIGYDEVRNALTDSSNRAMLIKYIRDLLKTDKDFRNMLIEDKSFMETVLNDMKEEVINEIVSDTEFIINILESDQQIKKLFIDSAMDNTSFLKDVLTTHKDEIVYLIHHEEKQELLDILDDASVKAEIVELLKNDPDFMDKLDNDNAFKDFVVDAIHDSIDLSAMFDDETIDAMLDELQGNSDFEQFKKDIVVDLNTDSFKKEVITSVRNNKSVVEAIVGELADDKEFKKTLIGNLSNDNDLKTSLVEAAIDNGTTKKQIVNEISSESSFKEEVLAEISNDISEFSIKIVKNIKDEPQFRQSVIDSVIVVESGELVTNDALFEMLNALKTEASVVNYVKSSAQNIINSKVSVNPPAVSDDEAISIIDAYINNDYNVVIGGYDVDISEIEADIDEYIIDLAAEYKDYVEDNISVYSKPVAEVDDHITSVIDSYLDGSDDTLTSDIEDYVSDIIDDYNNDSVFNEMEAEIDKYIDDAVDSYVNGTNGDYDSVIDDYIDDIKSSYNPSATTGIDGKINKYINDAIDDYVSGTSNELTSEIEDYIVNALNDFDANDNTGVNGVINNNIKSILDDYIAGTTTEYTQYINDYIDDVVNDFVNGNPVDNNIKDYIDSHMKDYIKESIEKYSVNDPSLNQDVRDYIDEKLPEFLFDHIRDYFHGTLQHGEIEDTIEAVIVDFVKMYINEDPALTNDDVIHLIEDNMVDYIIEQLTSDDEKPDKVEEFVVHTKTNFANKLKEEDISEYKDYIEQYIESDKDTVKAIIKDNYAEIVEYVLNNVNNADINEYMHDIIIEKGSTLSDDLINSFIDDNINDILTNDFIKEYIDTHENDEDLMNMVLNHLTSDKIVEYINTIRTKDKQNNTNELGKFIDEAIKVFKDMDFYKSLIACLDSKAATYKVTNENIYFMEAIGDAIGNRSFEDALELLGAGQVRDVLIKLNDITDGEISTLYYDAAQSFSKGIDEIKEKIDVDPTYTKEHPMSLCVNINFVSMIDKYYTKLHDKVTDKVNSVAPYYYTENQYLQEFIDGIAIDSYLEFNPAAKTEANSGYKFKTIMEYYDLMYNNLLLLDKAVLWYGPNTPAEFVNLRDDIANDIIRGFDKLQSILSNLDEDGKIFGSYTIKDVTARVESLKKFGNSVPALNSVIDNVCKILSKVEGGEVLAKGYTLDDLVELSERLDKAVATLRDEEYEKLNSELESLIDKTIQKMDEIIKELDKDGTILGKISIDDLASKVDALNNVYDKFEGKIDSALGKLADIEKGSVSGKLNIGYWEDILFGEDDYNRFDLDDIFDVACPRLGKFRVNDPFTDNNRRLVIDEFKVKGGGATVTFDRYLN